MKDQDTLKQLLQDIRDYLEEECEFGWDRYTDIYIIPRDEYSYEERMEKGDSVAWDLIKRIDKLLTE